jgi:hypothetical protein
MEWRYPVTTLVLHIIGFNNKCLLGRPSTGDCGRDPTAGLYNPAFMGASLGDRRESNEAFGGNQTFQR